MFITPDIIEQLKSNYGRPEYQDFHISVTQREIDFIRSTQRDGRRHDVTLYIVKDKKIIVIAKHFYPPGMYRAPSGGVNRGEELIEGAKREAFEETGCRIELDHFLLVTNVKFERNVEPPDELLWHSYVFQAHYVSGDFQFTDKHEIREVRLAGLDEFTEFARIMRQMEIGGLRYRAALHERVAPLLKI